MVPVVSTALPSSPAESKPSSTGKPPPLSTSLVLEGPSSSIAEVTSRPTLLSSVVSFALFESLSTSLASSPTLTPFCLRAFGNDGASDSDGQTLQNWNYANVNAVDIPYFSPGGEKGTFMCTHNAITRELLCHNGLRPGLAECFLASGWTENKQFTGVLLCDIDSEGRLTCDSLGPWNSCIYEWADPGPGPLPPGTSTPQRYLASNDGCPTRNCQSIDVFVDFDCPVAVSASSSAPGASSTRSSSIPRMVSLSSSIAVTFSEAISTSTVAVAAKSSFQAASFSSVVTIASSILSMIPLTTSGAFPSSSVDAFSTFSSVPLLVSSAMIFSPIISSSTAAIMLPSSSAIVGILSSSMVASSVMSTLSFSTSTAAVFSSTVAPTNVEILSLSISAQVEILSSSAVASFTPTPSPLPEFCVRASGSPSDGQLLQNWNYGNFDYYDLPYFNLSPGVSGTFRCTHNPVTRELLCNRGLYANIVSCLFVTGWQSNTFASSTLLCDIDEQGKIACDGISSWYSCVARSEEEYEPPNTDGMQHFLATSGDCGVTGCQSVNIYTDTNCIAMIPSAIASSSAVPFSSSVSSRITVASSPVLESTPITPSSIIPSTSILTSTSVAILSPFTSTVAQIMFSSTAVVDIFSSLAAQLSPASTNIELQFTSSAIQLTPSTAVVEAPSSSTAAPSASSSALTSFCIRDADGQQLLQNHVVYSYNRPFFTENPSADFMHCTHDNTTGAFLCEGQNTGILGGCGQFFYTPDTQPLVCDIALDGQILCNLDPDLTKPQEPLWFACTYNPFTSDGSVPLPYLVMGDRTCLIDCISVKLYTDYACKLNAPVFSTVTVAASSPLTSIAAKSSDLPGLASSSSWNNIILSTASSVALSATPSSTNDCALGLGLRASGIGAVDGQYLKNYFGNFGYDVPYFAGNVGSDALSCSHNSTTRELICESQTTGIAGGDQYFITNFPGDTLLCDISPSGKLTCDMPSYAEPEGQENLWYACNNNDFGGPVEFYLILGSDSPLLVSRGICLLTDIFVDCVPGKILSPTLTAPAMLTSTPAVLTEFCIRALGDGGPSDSDGMFLQNWNYENKGWYDMPYWVTNPVGDDAFRCTLNSENRELLCNGGLYANKLGGCQWFYTGWDSNDEAQSALLCDIDGDGKLICDGQGPTWYSCSNDFGGTGAERFLNGISSTDCGQSGCQAVNIYTDMSCGNLNPSGTSVMPSATASIVDDDMLFSTSFAAASSPTPSTITLSNFRIAAMHTVITKRSTISSNIPDLDGQFLTNWNDDDYYDIPYFTPDPQGSDVFRCTWDSITRALLCHEGMNSGLVVQGCTFMYTGWYFNAVANPLLCDIDSTGKISCDDVPNGWYSCFATFTGGSERYLNSMGCNFGGDGSLCQSIDIYAVLDAVPLISSSVEAISPSSTAGVQLASSTVALTLSIPTSSAISYGTFHIRASGSDSDGQMLQEGTFAAKIYPYWSPNPPDNVFTCTHDLNTRKLLCHSGQNVGFQYGIDWFNTGVNSGQSPETTLLCDIDPNTMQITCDSISWYSCISDPGPGEHRYVFPGTSVGTDCQLITIYVDHSEYVVVTSSVVVEPSSSAITTSSVTTVASSLAIVTPIPTSTPLASTTFRLRAKNGTSDGQFLKNYDYADDWNFPYWATDPQGTDAWLCTLKPDRRLLCNGDRQTYMFAGTLWMYTGWISDLQFEDGANNLHCDISGSGQLTCDTFSFYSCVSTGAPFAAGSQRYLTAGNTDSVESSCESITVYVDIYPSCASVTVEEGPTYGLFYSGIGVLEKIGNGGNDDNNYPPLTTTFPGYQDACTAAKNCATFAIYSTIGYWSFSLYLLQSTGQWSCIAWIDTQGDTAAFSIASSDVLAGFGYSCTGCD